jgi:hypothetical protein
MLCCPLEFLILYIVIFMGFFSITLMFALGM